MFTDRDFYKPVVSSAVDEFGVDTLAVLLNAPAGEVTRWAEGRSRPPTHLVLQIIDLMRSKGAEERRASGQAGVKRVLVATAAAARDELAGILSDCPVDFACSIEEGIDALGRQPYSHAVIGYLFAESHMFEFAQQVRRTQPLARVLCVKAAGRPLGPQVRSGLDAAAREIGCEGFFDLTAGDIPETFNRVFNEILAHFRLAERALDEGDEKVNAVIGRLRSAVQELGAPG